MKRIVVAISLKMMNQWDVLEQGTVIGGHEVIFHSDPRMTIRKDRTFFNFDLAIDDGTTKIDGFSLSSIVPKNRLIIIPRFNKVEQHLRIRTAIDDALLFDIDFSDFKSVNMYHNSQTNGSSHLQAIDEPVVIKPLDGARGIGQFLVKQPSYALLKIVDAICAMRQGRLKEEEVIESLDKYSDGFTYATSGERQPHEGMTALKIDGMCIQEFIPDISHEYRLITDADCKIVYCQNRKIKVDAIEDFPQAIGSAGTIDDEVPIEKVVKESAVEAIEYLAKNVVGPCSSIDMFVTKNGEWGFFEYCNQFGIVGVRTKVVKGVCEGLILKAISDLDL